MQKMLKEGVMEPSHSTWSSLVVFVEKKDGSCQIYIDYHLLNSITKMGCIPPATH